METIFAEKMLSDGLTVFPHFLGVMTVSLELCITFTQISTYHSIIMRTGKRKLYGFPSRVFLHGLGSKCQTEIHC